jgi:Mn-dependent DtxR family transcriptional regulator
VTEYKALKAAMDKVGHAVDEELLMRVARHLQNPQGCERCGSPTKVGFISPDNKTMTLACCGYKAKVAS